MYMVRNFKKFMIYSFSVLLTKLIYDLIKKSLPIIESTRNPYYDVAIGMVLALIIFYPLYYLTHVWMEKFSGHYVKHARKIHSNSIVALALAYILGIVVLFGFFMKVKFNINIVTEALKSLHII
jgi:hypothetical protein